VVPAERLGSRKRLRPDPGRTVDRRRPHRRLPDGGLRRFLDLIEIKRPEGNLSFWASARDHGNLVPHTDLIKAITQASRYLFEIEREFDGLKFFERIGAVRAIKPRCVLIFGRSTGWRDDERARHIAS
jgi:hypothetical protein